MPRLIDMELDEISLVKKGANQYSKVSIAKSLESEEKNMENDLFDENGQPVDTDNLEEGDVVFDDDGNEYEVKSTEDDDDDEDYGEGENTSASGAPSDEAIGKAFWDTPIREGRKFVRRAPARATRAKRNVKREYESFRDLRAMKRGMGDGYRTPKPGRTAARGEGMHGNAYRPTAGAIGTGSSSGTAGALEHVGRGSRTSGGPRGWKARTNEALGPITRHPRVAAGGAAGAAALGGGAYAYNRNRDEVGKSLRQEFSKALTDEDRDEVINKAFDAIDEYALQAQYAAEIAKSEQDARVFNEYVGIAKSYTLPFEDDDVAYAMMEIEKSVSPETAELVAKTFELASNAIDTEIGYEGVGSDVMESAYGFMDEIGKSGDPDTFLSLMENNPSLYDEYLAERGQ